MSGLRRFASASAAVNLALGAWCVVGHRLLLVMLFGFLAGVQVVIASSAGNRA